MSRDLQTRIRARLDAEGLVAGAWSNGPGDRYTPHRHDYDKVLVAALGSIEFQLPELGQTAELAAGDRLDLPAGTLHGALVGPRGVTCLEAHLMGGALPYGLREVPRWGLGRPSDGSTAEDADGAVETDPVGAA